MTSCSSVDSDGVHVKTLIMFTSHSHDQRSLHRAERRYRDIISVFASTSLDFRDQTFVSILFFGDEAQKWASYSHMKPSLWLPTGRQLVRTIRPETVRSSNASLTVGTHCYSPSLECSECSES